MTIFDLILIGLYLLGMVWIGFYFKKKVTKTTDYYLAGRSLNYFVIMATVCASIIGGGAMIGRGGVTYSQGAVAIMLGLPYLIGMYVFSGISGRIQKIGVLNDITSIPDLMEYRFGTKVKYLTAFLIAFTMMATVGTQITATATLIKTIGGFSYETGAWIAVIIFVSYTAVSGLFGVVYTDVAQFIILMLFMYILLPIIALVKVGGVSTMIQSVPNEMLSIKPSSEIIGWIFTNLVFTLAGAEMWQRAFAAKSPKDAKRGMILGNTVYAYTIIITLVIGLSAYILLPNVVNDYGAADAAIPALVIHLLPVGITGLTIASLFAVLMSSADTYLLISVQTLLRDILKPLWPNIEDKKELFYSRVVTVLLGFGALIIALYIRQAYKALMFAWTFYAASLGLPAFAALYWKKATKEGITAGIIVGFVTSIVWKLVGSPFGVGAALPGSILCGLALILVTHATYKEENPTPFPHLSSLEKVDCKD
ncbi:sodium:solute symporter family protein [Crassaminicella profunda]|uniref:sodium:solute symporter family protein n=1 Tax=Crassaminicella profunda TaxID=1286698 RepID=UPI001FED184C|nr:sodium:solute symporter family protein [Crassaminicella profunda]